MSLANANGPQKGHPNFLGSEVPRERAVGISILGTIVLLLVQLEVSKKTPTCVHEDSQKGPLGFGNSHLVHLTSTSHEAWSKPPHTKPGHGPYES